MNKIINIGLVASVCLMSTFSYAGGDGAYAGGVAADGEIREVLRMVRTHEFKKIKYDLHCELFTARFMVFDTEADQERIAEMRAEYDEADCATQNGQSFDERFESMQDSARIRMQMKRINFESIRKIAPATNYYKCVQNEEVRYVEFNWRETKLQGPIGDCEQISKDAYDNRDVAE